MTPSGRPALRLRSVRRAIGTGAGLFEAERLARSDDHDGVVQEAVEEGGRGGLDGQEVPPLLERPVAGQAQATPLVGRGHETEQQLRAGLIEGREAELVD